MGRVSLILRSRTAAPSLRAGARGRKQRARLSPGYAHYGEVCAAMHVGSDASHLKTSRIPTSSRPRLVQPAADYAGAAAAVFTGIAKMTSSNARPWALRRLSQRI